MNKIKSFLRGFKWWHYVIMAVAILAVFAAIGYKLGWFTALAAGNNDNPVDVDTKKALTVNLDDVSKLYPNVSREFLRHRMSEKDAERTSSAGFTDAVSFPLTTTDKSSALKEVEEEILRCPIYADMVIRGLKDIKVTSKGETIGTLNPWMGEFVKKTDSAYALGEEVHPRGVETWLTQNEGDAKTYVTEEFRAYAVYTCTLLERLENLGIMEGWKSSKNYNLPFVAKNSSRRTAEADYQEDKPALVLRYVKKDSQVLFNIGFNKLDRRFELIEQSVVEKQTQTGGNITPTPTPTPTPVPPKPVPPTPDPTPKKDVTQDPAIQQPPNIDGGKVRYKDDPGPGEVQPTRPEQATDTRHAGSSSSGSTSTDTGNTSSTSGNTPPPATPTHKEESHYTDPSTGQQTNINDNTVFDGRVVLPD